MESSNLTARTYTAPTCVLEVTTQGSDGTRSAQINPPIDFTLQLNITSPHTTERVVVLKGDRSQLAGLHREVSTYVQNLISSFPRPEISPALDLVPIDADNIEFDLEAEVESEENNHLDVAKLEVTSDAVSDEISTPASQSSTCLSLKNVDRILKQSPNGDLKTDLPPRHKPSSHQPPKTNPHLRMNQLDRSHDLHLGDLDSNGSGQVVNLSALELFDLAAVLDRAGAEIGIDPTIVPEIGRENQERKLDQQISFPLIGVPESSIPRPSSNRFEHRHLSPLFASVPWAAAAAVAVGVPLLFLSPSSSSLKELASQAKLPKVKLPNLSGVKRDTVAQVPQREPLVADPGSTAVEEKPWQVQSVNSPIEVKPKVPSDPTNISILDSLSSTQLDPTPGSSSTTSPVDKTNSAALAPLPGVGMGTAGANSSQALGKITTANRLPNNLNLPAHSQPGKKTSSATTKNPELKATLGINQYINPIVTLRSGEKISPPDRNLPKISMSDDVTAATIKFANDTISASSRNKTKIAPQSMAKAKSPVKPAPSKSKPKSIALKSKSTPEPFKANISLPFSPDLGITTPPPFDLQVPAMPDRPSSYPPIFQPESKVKSPIKQSSNQKAEENSGMNIQPDPSSPSQLELTAPQSSPIVPVQPATGVSPSLQLPSSSPGVPLTSTPSLNADGMLISDHRNIPVDRSQYTASSTLLEAKRYLENKWQPDLQQFSPLEYVVKISAKSGVVKNIDPKGNAAQIYIERTGLIKPGEQIVSPIGVEDNDHQIRAVLKPDGQVDVFEEPEKISQP